MKQPVFTGTCTALVTPFKDDFVDFDKLGQLIEFQIQGGVSAICICGTTGEAPTQSVPEHLAAVEYAVKCADGRVKIIAGTGSNDTAHAVKMSTAAETSGADGLLMVTPYYNKTTQKGLYEHYMHLADRVTIPIILYNVPSRTGVGFTAETYKKLSQHENINGVKEASSSTSLAARTLALCGDDLNIWSGNDDQIVPLMSIGAKGVVSVLSNICPAETVKLTQLCLEGNYAEAGKMQVDYMELIDALFCEVNPIPVKTALNLMGMNVGPVRMPLCEMEDKNLETLKQALRHKGLID